MAECHKCRGVIRSESSISCSGVCNKVYHRTSKCAGIDQYSAKILESDNFVRFICDDCIQYVHNVDSALKNIQDDIYKNKQHLNEYKNELEISLKHNENEIKQLLEGIEKRYEERLQKIDKVQKVCERSVDEVKKLCCTVSEYQNKNNDICNIIEDKNEKLYVEIKKNTKRNKR